MMKASVITGLVAVSSAAPTLQDIKAQTAFKDFVKQFNKKYEIVDIFERFANFRNNQKIIAEHNAKNLGWTMAINEFSDMSQEEFKTMSKGYIPRNNNYFRSLNLHRTPADFKVKTTVDWVADGAVTPVKNQGNCNSGWSFSTTGAVEGATQIATGTLTSLSEQQLVDCAGSFGNDGCNGGLMDNAFKYVIKNGGLTSEDEYPYKAKEALKCKKDEKVVPTSKITGFKDVSAGSEEDLMAALNLGPVSIAIEADQMSFQHYKSGVFDGECGEQLDHGVLLVGAGTEDGKDYWTIKNSWGESWGQDGYIKVIRGKNICGLADSASYPTV